MENLKRIPHAVVGVALFAIGVSLFFEIMNSRGFFARFGSPDRLGILGISVVAGVSLPPILTGLYTIFLRPLRSPVWSREASRTVLGSMGAGIGADMYASYLYSRPVAVGLLVMTMLVGVACLYVLRTWDRGIPVAPAPNGAATLD